VFVVHVTQTVAQNSLVARQELGHNEKEWADPDLDTEICAGGYSGIRFKRTGYGLPTQQEKESQE